MNPTLESLTPAERRALLAGLLPDPERTAVWTELWRATKRLGAHGLIEMASQRNAGGQVLTELPLHLTQAGHRLARELEAELARGQA